MKTFKFQADIEFQAKDIDEAFQLLSDHFEDLLTGWTDKTWFTGKMELHPK